MTIYKLHTTSSGDSVASLDIQLDGIIQAIHMTMRLTGVNGLNEGQEAEISFLSTSTFGVNDVRGSLMIIQSQTGFLTSGMANVATNSQVSSLEIPVNAGERIHMHTNDVGAPGGRSVHGYLYVADKGILRQAGRRR